MEEVHLKLSKERGGRSLDLSSYCQDHVSSTRPDLTVADNLSQQSNLHTETLSLQPFQASLVQYSPAHAMEFELAQLNTIHQLNTLI